MAYTPVGWENLPTTTTPVNKTNLKHMDDGIKNNDDNISALASNFESGTFTPTIFGGTTAGTATYNLQEGHYCKVGKIVHFEIRIGCTLTGSSGLLLIGGIPNLGSYYEPSAMNVVSTLSGIIGEPLCTRTYGNNLLLDTYGINPLNNRNWDSTNYIYVSGTMLLV